MSCSFRGCSLERDARDADGGKPVAGERVEGDRSWPRRELYLNARTTGALTSEVECLRHAIHALDGEVGLGPAPRTGGSEIVEVHSHGRRQSGVPFVEAIENCASIDAVQGCAIFPIFAVTREAKRRAAARLGRANRERAMAYAIEAGTGAGAAMETAAAATCITLQVAAGAIAHGQADVACATAV